MTAAQVLVLIALLVISIIIDIIAWRHVFRGWDAMRLRIDAQDREITRLERTVIAHNKSIAELINRNGAQL